MSHPGAPAHRTERLDGRRRARRSDSRRGERGELVHECALAIKTRVFAGRIAQTMHAYPTIALGLQQAAAQRYELGRLMASDESGAEGIKET